MFNAFDPLAYFESFDMLGKYFDAFDPLGSFWSTGDIFAIFLCIFEFSFALLAS